MWAPNRDNIWPQGYNLDNLGRGSLNNCVPNIKGLSLSLVSERKIFKVIPYIGLC